MSAVRESDAGLYSCVRGNEAGEVRGSAYLGVLGKHIIVLLLCEILSCMCVLLLHMNVSFVFCICYLLTNARTFCDDVFRLS